MAKKIFLSPSNQFGNKYASGSTNEGEQMGLLAQLVEERLISRGFAVKTLHDYSMQYKVQTADSWGADLYVPLHTNAYNGSVGGTRIFYWDKGGAGYQAGLAIYNRLAPFTPGTSDGMRQDPSLYEIRMPSAPTAYIEVEFHDNKQQALWIQDHLPEIADRICQGICDYYGVLYSSRYSVCLGSYDSRSEAEKAIKSITIREE